MRYRYFGAISGTKVVANLVCLGMSTDKPNCTAGRLGGMGIDMTDYSSCSIQRFGNGGCS